LQYGSLALIQSLVFGSANLPFGLEPVIKLRAGLITALDVEVISAATDALFEWSVSSGVLLRVGGRHGVTSGEDTNTARHGSEGMTNTNGK